MPKKKVLIDQIGMVTIHKRKGSRNIRLSLAHDGSIRLSMPVWMPYKFGIDFATQRRSWVQKNRRPITLLNNGHRIGKAHIIKVLVDEGKTSVRLNGNHIVVKIPDAEAIADSKIQQLITKAAIRALKKEAATLLPKRLEVLSEMHGFEYKSVNIKTFKTRWGSCNHQKVISLNCYLMQLPWDLIDYVLLHELMHTRIMAHGKKFWDSLSEYVDDLSTVRKRMRDVRPHMQAVKL